MNDKASKSDAGYIYRPETDYLCGECAMAKPRGESKPEPIGKRWDAGCAWFGPAEAIDTEQGSCIYFAHSRPGQFEVPWFSLFTKLQLGYIDNKNGFSCKRCEYFDPAEMDCKRVDKDTDGDTPGEIHPNACCDFQEPDKIRGQMSSAEVLDYIARSPKTAKSKTGPRYRVDGN